MNVVGISVETGDLGDELRAKRDSLPRASGGAGGRAPCSVKPRELLWEHCRNNLGIARLLVHEGRPEPFVATACRMAVETACRTALEHAGFLYDGDLDGALSRLSAPEEIAALAQADAAGAQRLVATERVVAWLAGYLRSEAPEHSWGY